MRKITLILSVIVGITSCKSLQWTPIENANQYQLERTKDEVIKKDVEVVLGKMQWNNEDAPCSAQFNFGEKDYCLQHQGKPDYQVEIAENGDTIGSIKSIKTHVSTLEWSGEDFILRPVNGKIVALYRDKAIARIYNIKEKWYLEITPEHENNQVLIAALLYKEREWTKQNQSDDDWIFFLLLPAIS